MKKAIGRLLNAFFRLFGLRICTINTLNNISADVRAKQKEAIQELEGCFRETLFKNLPACDSRVDLLGRLTGTNVSEALYIIEFLHMSMKNDGDICEFGIADGTTSTLLANEISKTNKNIWLFDSFKGLPKPTSKDVLIDDVLNLGEMSKYEGMMSYSVNEVKLRLDSISFPDDRVKIVPGFIEDTIKTKKLPDKVCFSYVDFDFYNPILVALRFLGEHLVDGGFIVVDDYDYFSSGAKTAVEEFLKEQNGKFTIILPHKFAGHFCILEKRIV